MIGTLLLYFIDKSYWWVELVAHVIIVSAPVQKIGFVFLDLVLT